MEPTLVNVYYLLNGEEHVVHNTYLAQGAVWVQTIIRAGGEITGVINVKDDE